MFQRILLSVDASPDSEKALKMTAELARVHGSDVLVVHGRDLAMVNPSGRTVPPSIEKLESPENAEAIINSAVADLEATGVHARGKVLPGQGHIGDKILEAANEDNADLIVLGSRGMSRLHEVMIGSVSNKIVHTATCPVLLVR